ncbi:AGAP005667-PA-like protein [Anopheles sinensis]|uniref:AGAP005667-PA-like protein n=1 Tax=Anopheles sinensis TaxID=74873 RepID=A0A084WUE4_ANOSI|nr:AGAP005667-PA-like protein [Anopheles sinensis]
MTLDAFHLKCEYQKCVIAQLRSPKETFLYRYFPDDVTEVVYTQLMVRHVSANILEGIGIGLQKRVNISTSPKVQRVKLTAKCNIYHLGIERTGLREIEFEENDKLKELIIVSSSLKSVPPSLRLLKNLQKVHIVRSLIQHLDLGLFCGHANLMIINFNRNRIHSIRNSKRECYTIIEATIHVEENFISCLDLELFDIFENKNELYLGGNQIALLSQKLTSETLNKFDLHDNRLLSLDICEWKTPSIKLLDLRTNLLTSLPQCVENLKNLEMLWLSSNRITSVTIESFATMWSLRDLSLDENNMTAIVLNSAHFPPQLQSLHITSNLLTSLNLSSIPVRDLNIVVTHNLIADFDVNGTSSNVTRLVMACNPIDCSWNSAMEKESAICTRDQEVLFVKRGCEWEYK